MSWESRVGSRELGAESRESRVELKVNVKSELWGLSCKARVISEEGPIIIGSYH
jgi:hypothetical protein